MSDTHEHAQTGPDLAHEVVAHPHMGFADTLHDRSHAASSSSPRSAASSGGNIGTVANPLEPGDILPGRKLRPLTGGEPVRVGPNRSRDQVVVVTHRDRCDPCLSYLTSLQALADQVRAEKAQVLALVGPAWQERASEVAVPLLATEAVLADRLSPAHTPVVAIADRYGQLFVRVDAGDDHRFPADDLVLHHLLDIGLRCPECGVPDVPSGTILPEAGTKSAGIHLHQ